MNDKTKKTIARLKCKAESLSYSGARIPSLPDIAAMLDDLGIKYEMRKSENVVEHRTKGRRYVNSRHYGKKGLLLKVGNIRLDSSDSYYSFNTWHYAQEILEMVRHEIS